MSIREAEIAWPPGPLLEEVEDGCFGTREGATLKIKR